MKNNSVSNEEVEKIKYEFYSNLEDFEKRLFNNLELLISRVNKLKDVERGSLDYWTYYDAILTQIRAMFIETPKLKKNYTVQNYLIKIGQKEIAQEIQDYMDIELYEGMSFKDAVKVSVDKFIAHYDKVDIEDVIIEQMCRAKLTEPNRNYNISNTLTEFMQLLLKGIANSCPLNQKNK